MIRIRYTFKTQDGRSSWGDSLVSDDTITDALTTFEYIKPRYLLENLLTLDMSRVIPDRIAGSDEINIIDPSGLKQNFIDRMKS